MMPPKRKTVPRSSPYVLKELIPEALAIKYEGLVYDEPRPCPRCGSVYLARHDVSERVFCTTITREYFCGQNPTDSYEAFTNSLELLDGLPNFALPSPN